MPFHPDESTQIFMSSDLENLLSHPVSLAWKASLEVDTRQPYRKLDSPLTKYLIGVGRILAGYAPITSDWNWSKSWEENNAAGARPSQVCYSSAGSQSPFYSLFAFGWFTNLEKRSIIG